MDNNSRGSNSGTINAVNTKPLKTYHTMYADFYLVPANTKDIHGRDIKAKEREHPIHGVVKVFSGYFYSGNYEHRWSLEDDRGESAPKDQILKALGFN